MANVDLAHLSHIDDAAKLSAVLTAVSGLVKDGTIEKQITNDLKRTSPNVELQGVEATPEGVFRVRDSNRFEAVANVYFVVHYGSTSPATSMSDSAPAYVFGHFDRDTVVIDKVSVELDPIDQ